MKRKLLVAIVSVTILSLLCVTAFAATVSISGKSETQLYSLLRETVSQISLNNLANRSSYSLVRDYNDFERNPFNHKNDKIMFSGTVIQVVEGYSGSVIYRIAMDGNGSKIFFIEYTRPKDFLCVFYGNQSSLISTSTISPTYIRWSCAPSG